MRLVLVLVILVGLIGVVAPTADATRNMPEWSDGPDGERIGRGGGDDDSPTKPEFNGSIRFRDASRSQPARGAYADAQNQHHVMFDARDTQIVFWRWLLMRLELRR